MLVHLLYSINYFFPTTYIIPYLENCVSSKVFLETLLSLIICLSQFIDGVGVKTFPKNFNNNRNMFIDKTFPSIPITFENIRITTPEDQCLEVVLPNTVIEKPEIKQIELFDGKIKFSGSTVSQLSVNSIVLYKDVNPSDVIFGINLKNIKIIKVDNSKKQKLIKRYQTLILMSTLVNKNTDEYKLMLLEILKLKKEIANTV